MSPADVELAKALITAGGQLVALAVEWFRTGQRPPADRVAAVWATLEQARAKLTTDAAADERWGAAHASTEPPPSPYGASTIYLSGPPAGASTIVVPPGPHEDP